MDSRLRGNDIVGVCGDRVITHDALHSYCAVTLSLLRLNGGQTRSPDHLSLIELLIPRLNLFTLG
jgi:hypothetical protein